MEMSLSLQALAAFLNRPVVEVEEGGRGFVTNWLKITGLEQPAVRRRGMNRRREEAPTRSVLR